MSKMSKLNIASRGNYRNKKGTRVFRYAVKGSPDAISAYKDAQGEYFIEDAVSGEILYFTPRFAGKNATLIVTEEGKVYVDMSELEEQASLIEQFGGNLGQAMADVFAKSFVNGSSASKAPAPTKAKTSDAEGLGGF